LLKYIARGNMPDSDAPAGDRLRRARRRKRA
jgi:hypothetical protein